MHILYLFVNILQIGEIFMENRKKHIMVKNPKIAIYLSLFEKPLKSGEVSNKLYGYLNTKVSTYLNQLENEGWVKHIRSKDYIRFKKGEKKDSRHSYYKATSKGLLTEINNRIIYLSKRHNSKKLLLLDNEMEKLESFLLGNSIKNYIADFIKYADKKEGRYFDKIITDLALHCLFKETVNVYLCNTTDNTSFYEKEFSKHDEPDKSYYLKKLEWDKLGLKLQSKLANLLENPSANHISYYFDNLLLLCEKLHDNKNKNINGNGHGLS